MRNDFYFQIEVVPEQINYTNKLVDYSIAHHPVTDIFINDPDGIMRKQELRFTGTIAEVVFADAYKLPRPTRSFGAIDGQDYGQDFAFAPYGKIISFDVKGMNRKNNNFKENYVLNIPGYQIHKRVSITDSYFCISLHRSDNVLIATFVGWIDKDEVINGVIGNLFIAGTKRIKDDGSSFIFQRDTYEIEFKDINSPFLNDDIKNMKGYKVMHILPPIKSIAR